MIMIHACILYVGLTIMLRLRGSPLYSGQDRCSSVLQRCIPESRCVMGRALPCSFRHCRGYRESRMQRRP